MEWIHNFPQKDNVLQFKGCFSTVVAKNALISLSYCEIIQRSNSGLTMNQTYLEKSRIGVKMKK